MNQNTENWLSVVIRQIARPSDLINGLYVHSCSRPECFQTYSPSETVHAELKLAATPCLWPHTSWQSTLAWKPQNSVPTLSNSLFSLVLEFINTTRRKGRENDEGEGQGHHHHQLHYHHGKDELGEFIPLPIGWRKEEKEDGEPRKEANIIDSFPKPHSLAQVDSR